MEIAVDDRATDALTTPPPAVPERMAVAVPPVAAAAARESGPVAPPSAPTHRWRWIWSSVGLIAALALLWFVVRPWLFGPVVIGAPVVRADLVQTLVASGHVATRFRSAIATQIAGIVTRIPVVEGQTVRAGDTLIVLDATETRALALQALGQAQQATAQARQLRELTLPAAEQTLAQAQATLLNVTQTFNRNLAPQGYDSPASRDEAQKNLDVARAAVRAAELTVFTNRPGGSNAVVVQTQLAQANANLVAARTRVAYRAILAPRSGVLISRNIEVGDVAQPGVALMLLSPSGEMDVVVQVDEKNLNLIRVGQHALVSADAFATQSFPADVIFVNPGIDLLRASVEVQLRVPSPPSYLKQDMTVSVDIEVARRPAALVVQSADIHDIGTPAPWVLVARDSHARRQAVTVGLVSAGKAEIVSGVHAGDALVPRSAGAVTDGHRIRLHADAAASP
jgi:HlyD family secretion protein